jgi:hypothetical protein
MISVLNSLPGKTGIRLFYEEKTKDRLGLSTRIDGNEVGFRFRVYELLLEEIAVERR